MAIRLIDCSECAWEPGSAMVPTFCADELELKTPGPVADVLGSAKIGDGDLPLAAGEGGGEPKSDTESSSSGRSSFSMCIIGSTDFDSI